MVDGKTIRGVRYNMDKFFNQCIDTYESLAGADYKCEPADTPFIAEDKEGRQPNSITL